MVKNVARIELGERLTVSVAEASKLLAISERSVRRAIESGELPSKRVGNRVLLPVPELQRWLCGETK